MLTFTIDYDVSACTQFATRHSFCLNTMILERKCRNVSKMLCIRTFFARAANQVLVFVHLVKRLFLLKQNRYHKVLPAKIKDLQYMLAHHYNLNRWPQPG